MNLFELFEDDGVSNEGNGDFISNLRSVMIDALMPLAAQGIPYITVQKIADKLKDQNSGIEIDRNLIMQVLDPDEVKLITKIEGDRIYFKIPVGDERKVDNSQQEKDDKHIANQAQQQAKKNIGDKGPLS